MSQQFIDRLRYCICSTYWMVTTQLMEQLPTVLMNTHRRLCALCKINNTDGKARFECNVRNVGLCLTQEMYCFALYHQTEH